MPVLALFGERGAGKSVALLQECKVLEAEQAATLWVNLGRYQTESGVVSALADAAAAGEAGEWWVFLDSLDEGLNVLPALGGLIADWIDSLTADQRRRVRLRFSCRTGRWPDILQDALMRHWPQRRQVQHVILTPLTVSDVAVAAEDYGLDAEVFTAVLRERGLMQLSKAPVTLLQLLEYHRVHGMLPATAADAYEQACLLLCSETRRPADIRELRAQPTGQSLLPVAARVAAAMQFGAQNVLSDDVQLLSGSGEITLAELEGGQEPGLLGDEVPCTTDELRRLTESHLLEPVGLLRWTFTHRSYQEFLAASYLRAHHVDPRAQTGLLWVGDGAVRHVYPAHREVAAWRCGSDSALFEDLLRDDPLVLLLADLPARPASDRVRVVEAIFRLAVQDDTIDFDNTTLHRLDHPGLPQQLLSRLRPEAEGLATTIALHVARRCPHPELTDTLLQVAETVSLSEERRALALQAIADFRCEDVQTVDRIRQLAAHDSSPEVVAAALDRLWPTHLGLRELLDCLRDPNPDYYGRAWMLRSRIPDQLTATQSAQALLWASDTLQKPLSGRSIVLATSLITRAVTLAGSHGIAELSHPEAAIAEALIALASHSSVLHSLEGRTEQQALGDALRAQHDLRRAVTLHLLTHIDVEQFFRLLSAVPHGALTTYDDAFYWMEHWGELADVPPALSRLLVSIAAPAEPELRARAEAARRIHPTLRHLTMRWDQDAPAPQPQQQADTPDESHTYSAARLCEALEAVHAAGSETVRHAWATVIDQMRCTHDGVEPPHLWAEPLLMWAQHTPSRPVQGSDLDAQLTSAAQHVLATVPSLPALLLAHGRNANPRLMLELSAFAILGSPDQLPPSPPARWAGWALALATTHPFNAVAQAVRDAFLPVCAEQAGPALTALIGEILGAPHTDPATTHDLARALGTQAQPDASEILLTWAESADRSLEHWQSITSALAFTGHPCASSSLRSVLENDPSGQAATPDFLNRWLMAAQMLLYSPHLPDLWPLVHEHLADDRVARAYIDQLGQRPVLHYAQPHQMVGLSEEALAELYLSLARHVTSETLDPPLRSGWSGEDHFGELIRSIPPLLEAKKTRQAAHQLRRLATQTGMWRLRHLARRTATSAAQTRHAPVKPPQLRALAEQSQQRRWVTDEGHLLALVLEALERFQDALRRPNGLSIALWNRSESSAAKAQWWPCWEEDLSDILAVFLLQDIGGHRVVVNREVQLDRPGLSGRRTDIQIEVPAPPGSGHDPVRLVIECKGCWNDTLSTALEVQLVGRYLDTPRTAGILLTGYFDCDRWQTKQRGCPATDHTLKAIDRHQQQQAGMQRDLKGVPVTAFTLDCTLP